jgi:DNA transposition AAA+ family ATPase
MNDPTKTDVDIHDQKQWCIDLHRSVGSWAEVAKRTGVPQGTISQFCSAKGYAGDNQKVANKIYQYRQMLAAQAQIEVDMPERPEYFRTETSDQLTHMLTYAQRFGRIVCAALAPGNSKTETARQYRACFPNVFLVTLTPSTAGLGPMLTELLTEMGERDAKGWPRKLSQRIRERASALRNPLIIIDEAQHAESDTLEEIRSWNDKVGVGVALFGNAGLLQTLEGGSRQTSFAQLFSRLGLRLERQRPLGADIDALANAWSIHDDQVRELLHKICSMPGGLRNGTHALELAFMICGSQGEMIAPSHLSDAWTQLSTRRVL